MSQEVTSKKKKLDKIELGDKPEIVKCPYCLNSETSIVQFKNGYISYILSFLALLIMGLFSSILFVPLIMLITKQLIHICSICGEEIGNDGRIFHSLGLKDKVVSFKFGELGCILTRKIVLGTLLLCITIAVLGYRLQNIPMNTIQGFHHHHEPAIPIDDTWKQFLEQCSKKEYLLDSVNRIKCERQYINRTVQKWKGYVIRIEDYRQSLYKYLHHAITILVRMDPAETEYFPDILLTLDSEYVEKLGDIVEQLHRGSEIIFSAIIKSLGDQQTTRHFHLQEIEKGERYIEIPPHLHDNGRYADTPGFLKGNN